MPQNYTIFIKNRSLRIIHDPSAKDAVTISDNNGTIEFSDDKEFLQKLKECIGQLTNGEVEDIDITGDATGALMHMVKGCFDKQIAAAGGAVYNKKNELLCIFRLGYWDLPKGKMEKGESLLETALREVQEETGLKHLEAGQQLSDTYHVYELKGKTIFKTTHWFIMHTNDMDLIPQTEEDITRAEWIAAAQLDEVYQNTYENIKFVIAEAMRTISL